MTNALPFTAVGKGEGYVVAKWGELAVVGVYFSPNRSLAEFETYLDGVAAVIMRSLPGRVLVMGDLNAKSALWGFPVTNPKGEALVDWAAELGLICLNRGSAQTCVRQRGGGPLWTSRSQPPLSRDK